MLSSLTNLGIAMNDNSQWKIEEYRGYDMHVFAQHRAVENQNLPGHGIQWDFTVRIVPHGVAPDADQADTATSDPDIFYSTQAIAENMGFLKGRELIDGRAVTGADKTEHGSRVL